MTVPLCPRCLRRHDFDPSWDAELHEMWCRADRRLSEVEERYTRLGLLRKQAEAASTPNPEGVLGMAESVTSDDDIKALPDPSNLQRIGFLETDVEALTERVKGLESGLERMADKVTLLLLERDERRNYRASTKADPIDFNKLQKKISELANESKSAASEPVKAHCDCARDDVNAMLACIRARCNGSVNHDGKDCERPEVVNDEHQSLKDVIEKSAREDGFGDTVVKRLDDMRRRVEVPSYFETLMEGLIETDDQLSAVLGTPAKSEDEKDKPGPRNNAFLEALEGLSKLTNYVKKEGGDDRADVSVRMLSEYLFSKVLQS